MMSLVSPTPRAREQKSRSISRTYSSRRYRYEPELSSTNSFNGGHQSLLATSPSTEGVFETMVMATETDRKASVMNNKLCVNGRQRSSRSLLGRHKDSNSSMNRSLLLRSHSMYRHPSFRGNTGPGSAGNKSQPVGEQTPSEGKWKTMSGKVASSVCSIPVKKLFFGVIIMSLVTLSWVGATHLLKSTYTDLHREILFNLTNHTWEASTNFTKLNHLHYAFDAPLFTTWFCSMGTIFFLPFYLCCQMCCRGNPVVRQPSNGNLARDANLSGANSKHRANGLAISGPGNGNVNIHTSSVAQGAKKVGVTIILKESVRSLREKGFTFGKFVGRCCLFSLLWMLTNYFYICSLRILGCTEVMALFATNVCFIYLLSWVILHEQFVGIRIVAVILGNTGIALLAYMDGINQSPTLGAVALAAAASAGLAIYKVLFKRVMGEVSFCQVAIFFSMIGLCTTLLFWPLVLTLAFTGLDCFLVSNLLANFGIVVTYETFITLGLVLAVPICAALDTHWYGAQFAGMKLAGIIVICLGFVIVLFPSNWPNCIHSLIRLGRRGQKKKEMGRKPPPDLRTGHLGSRLRSPSGR
eukprot:maker-scaffold246_size239296-snap-gene-1.35 protein:Tk01941 transcript:maker-scaffold246_size239296-snap-gene-1.35-mRNA-1 annotation:"solute carrier family 35 member f3 isoform x2"